MDRSERLKNPRVILAAATGINLVSGILYSWSVISGHLVSVAGWSSSAASMPYTVAILVFAGVSLVAGRLQDALGPRRFVIAGILLTATGLVVSGYSSTPVQMILSYGILVGTGISFGYSCVTPVVMKWWHRDRKGMVTGIVVAGSGLASVYVAPATAALIRSLGLPLTFRFLGLFVLATGLPMALMIQNPPEGYLPAPPAARAGSPESPKIEPWNYDWREMLKTPQFRLLWMMFALAASAGLMIIGTISQIAAEQAGYSAGFLLVGLLAIFNTAGRILGGALSDRIGRIRSLQLMVLLQGLNMLSFSLYRTAGLMAMGTAIAGASYGALLTIFPSITSDYYGMRNFGLNYGVLFTAWGIAGVIGPVIASGARDLTGSFGPAYVVSAVLLGVTLVLTFFLRPVTGRKER